MSAIVDLSKLEAPQVLETLDFESLLAARKAAFIALYPESEQALWTARLALESEPITKLIEENAYFELLIRTRINNAAKAVMLAYATGTDLDQLAANFNVQRLTITPADDSTTPPTEAVMESDDRLRQRVQMSFEGLSTAGSIGSYLYHTLSASAQVKNASILSPQPGVVRVVVLSTENNGTPSAELLNLVKNTLNAEEVRPLCDTVEVVSAELVPYTISAQITLLPSAFESMTQAAVDKAIASYISTQHQLGQDITLSGIYAALHQSGVHNVVISQPTQNLVIEAHQCALCQNVSLQYEAQRNE